MSLKAGQYIGLLKFFREEAHLNMFMDGCLYCNTPEYYRISDAKGVSDINESSHFSVRSRRGDSPFEIYAEEKYLGEASDFIVRSGRGEGWLHCWMMLNVPNDAEEFEKLTKDIHRLKEEFGPYYVFVDAKNSHEMIRRINEDKNLNLEVRDVKYGEGKFFIPSIWYKEKEYKYQRELRLVFSECDVDCIEPRKFIIEKGFRDIASINIKIELYASVGSKKLEFILKI